MNNKLLLLLLVAAIDVVRVAALNVTISPDHVRMRKDPSTVTFTCAADSPLAGCQFSWWDYNTEAAGPLLEPSRGPQSRADPAHLDNTGVTGYSYTGRGLGAGECGVSLQVEGGKFWIVACRVRAETGGWQYAWADLFAESWGRILHNMTTPRDVVVLHGGEARVEFKAQEPISWCSFYLPGASDWLNFNQGAASPNSTGRHRYLGAGLESGECGLTLTGITQADNGPVKVYKQAPGPKTENRIIALIVAHPPPAPTISLVYTGFSLTATCRVGISRPLANISWILGDKVIRQDESDDSQADLNNTWRWPWMAWSMLQTLTLQLKPADQGQVLKCVVSHVALVQPHEAREIIVITGAAYATTSGTTNSAINLTTATSTTSTAPSSSSSTAPRTTTSTVPRTTASTAPEPNFLATNYLELLCLQFSQHGNTSGPKDEVREYRIQEAKAAARAAELVEEVARLKLEASQAETAVKALESVLALEASKVALEAAKSSARAEDARARGEVAWARAEEAKARTEEARAQNAEEELQSARERRAQNQQTAAKPSE